MAEVNRGEVWQFGFPAPGRRRPVLVLTRQEIIGHLNSVTVAPITTTIRGIPSEVVIGTESGLKTTSAINLDNLATVPKKGLRAFVGTVSPEVFTQVREALLFALGFDDLDAEREAQTPSLSLLGLRSKHSGANTSFQPFQSGLEIGIFSLKKPACPPFSPHAIDGASSQIRRTNAPIRNLHAVYSTICNVSSGNAAIHNVSRACGALRNAHYSGQGSAV